MADDIACSLPDTQTQGSQLEWTQDTPLVIPTMWGRLYPTKESFRTLGICRSLSSESVHSLTDYIDLSEPHFKMGRSPECDLVLKIGLVKADVLKGVSKEHFLISRETCEQHSPVILHDLSYNGTFINGLKVGKGNKQILENKDEISIVNPSAKMFVFVDLFKNDKDQVPIEISRKYYISKQLGVGACGVVKLVYNKMTCKKFAMKVIAKKRLTNGQIHPLNNPEKIMNEVHILKALKHPCIISTEEVVDTPQAVYIILELMEGGELFDRVSARGRLSERCVKIIFRQMVLAVKYLHDQGITHRDLKPENVLLHNADEEPLVKLTDFGLSKFVGEESFMKTMCGTPLYVAPEVLLAEGRNSYGPQVDVWSLGVIFFICLSGYLPFSQEYKGTSLREQIVKGKYMFSPKHWEGVGLPARKLMLKMLQVNPAKRITLDDILEDKWMQDESVINRVNELINHKPLSDSEGDISHMTVVSVNPAFKRNLSEDGEGTDPAPKRRRVMVEGVVMATVVESATSSDDTVDALSVESLSFNS